MKTILGLVCIIIVFAVGAAGQGHSCTSTEREEWFHSALNEIQTVKVGMTRKDLLKVFTRAGGFFTSTRLGGTYTYIGNPYIRVDVEFSPVSTAADRSAENPSDVIRVISKPYLAPSQYD